MRKTKLIIIILVILLIMSAVGIFYLYKKTATITNPEDLAKQESAQILKNVGKVTILPENEVPAIATVSDLAQLKGQSFFDNALKGDKVLVYQKSKKVILWRPSINKIVEMSYFNAEENNNPTQPPQTTEPINLDTKKEDTN